MKLLTELKQINQTIENDLMIQLTDADFADGYEEIKHIYFHEACHAAISHSIPWIHTLDEEEHTAVDEIMALLLEMEFGEALDASSHSTEEHIEELKLYDIDISPDGFKHLLDVWQAYFWPNKDLAGMAAYVLTYIRHRRVIYHILPKKDWLAAEKSGTYTPPSLNNEGFIHCSKIDQVVRSANQFFVDQDDLYLLCIASEKVRADIRYEDSTGEGILFPHIYGPLNLSAIVDVSPLEKNWRGKFVLPKGVSGLQKE